MIGHEAETLTRLYWNALRADMVDWMIKERGFSHKGAARAAESFIETMAFVAAETGEPQLGKSRSGNNRAQSVQSVEIM